MKKILIGEDSYVVKNITRNVLRAHSYESKCAMNGQELYDMLLAEDFDIILLYIHMPIMDGLTCAQKIRKEAPKNKQQIPIIAVTSNNAGYKESDFKKHGIN